MIEDHDRWYRAVQSRDARFDGVFYAGVRTTGIYCRPSCPARTPHQKNVQFYPSARPPKTPASAPGLAPLALTVTRGW